MVNGIIHRLSETDKHQHIAVSCAIMMTSLFFMGVMSSFVITFAIGIIKEIWDKKYGSGFCWYDVLANTVGMVLAIAMHQLIN